MSKHTPITPDPTADPAHPHADTPAVPPEQASDTPPLLPDTALVPVAQRHDGWTPQRQRQFIETLADTGSVKAAAQAAGMSEQSAWRLRRRADARAFSAAWEAALEQGVKRLLTVALDRAINGTLRPRYYHGELIAEERVHHNGLLMALIRHGDKSLSNIRGRAVVTRDWETAMTRLGAGADTEQDLAGEPYSVWKNGPLLVTDCPPGSDFSRGFQWGAPFSADYMRELTSEEVMGLAARQGQTFDTEDDRRALFGLDALDGILRQRRRRR